MIELIRNRKGLRERKKEEHLDSSSVEGEQMQYAVMVLNRISVFLAGDCIVTHIDRDRRNIVVYNIFAMHSRSCE